jgi:transposase
METERCRKWRDIRRRKRRRSRRRRKRRRRKRRRRKRRRRKRRRRRHREICNLKIFKFSFPVQIFLTQPKNIRISNSSIYFSRTTKICRFSIPKHFPDTFETKATSL